MKHTACWWQKLTSSVFFADLVPVSSIREREGDQHLLTASWVPGPMLGTHIALLTPKKLPWEELESQTHALSRPPPCQSRHARRVFGIARLSLHKGRGV